MAFLVRKLNRMEEVFSLVGVTDIHEIYADIPTTEFRTKKGTLSCWHIETLEEIENAVLAVAITSSDITKMDFIVIDTDFIHTNSLSFEQTYAGQDIAIPDLQNTHYDIIGITTDKLINCTKIYQSVAELDPDGNRFIIRYTAGEIKDLLKQAIEAERIDDSKAPRKIKEHLDKLRAG